MEIAKDFRVGFVKHVDLLQQTYEKCLVVDISSVCSVLLLVVNLLVVIFVVQFILGARFIWSLAIIRCVHVIRCVVDQQIVKTKRRTAENERKLRSENAMKWHFASCP